MNEAKPINLFIGLVSLIEIKLEHNFSTHTRKDVSQGSQYGPLLF